MNSYKNKSNHNSLSAYWRKLDKRVLKVLNEKVIAYKNELELNLELEGYGHRDIGVSIRWLSEEAPVKYVVKKIVTICNTDYTFYFFRKKKTELVNLVLDKKKKILAEYIKKSQNFGIWVHNEFYPRVLNKIGFIIEGISVNNYNLVKIEGDFDLITSPSISTNIKIFIDVKNRLTVYSNEDLQKIFNNLSKFDFNITPIVIARKIYENPKELLKSRNGEFIEMGKVLIQQKYKNISENFNNNIANVTRVIPGKLIPPDIKKRFIKITKLKEGTNFYKLNKKMRIF